MGKGELLGLYQKGAVTRSAKQFLANVQHLRAALREAEEQGRPSTFIQQAKHDTRAALLTDLRETLAEERAELQEKLENEKARYQREFLKESDKHHHALHRAEVLYASMNDAELAAVAGVDIMATKDHPGKVLRNMTPTDPDQYLAFRSALRQRGLDDAMKIVTEAGNRLNIAEPWRNTPVGEAVAKGLRLLEPVRGGGTLIDGGNGHPVGVDFDSLMDAMDEAEADDADQ